MSGPESSGVESYHAKANALKGKMEALYGNTPAWDAVIAGHAAEALITGNPGKASKDFNDGELREAYRSAKQG